MQSDVSKVVKRRCLTGLVQTVLVFGALLGFSFVQQSDEGKTAFIRASLFSLLMMAGYTGNRLFNEFEKTSLWYKYYKAGTSAGMIVAGIGLWQLLVSFNEFRLWPGRFALIFLCGLTALALSRLAGYRNRKKEDILNEFLGWMETNSWLKFLFGIVIGLYLVYFRPYLTLDQNALMLTEWFVLSILTLAILFRFWISISHFIVDDEPGLEWKKHNPDIQSLTGIGHDYMTRAERRFVSEGEPMRLYVLLITLLDENRVNEPCINRMLDPLLSFSGSANVSQINTGFSRQVRIVPLSMRQEILTRTYENITSGITLYRSDNLGRNHRQNNDQPEEEQQKPLSELQKRFLYANEKSGIFVRLVLLLSRSGRNQEHIIRVLQELTDSDGNPSRQALLSLINEMKTAGVIG